MVGLNLTNNLYDVFLKKIKNIFINDLNKTLKSSGQLILNIDLFKKYLLQSSKSLRNLFKNF